MKARSMINGASYSPEVSKATFEAFDLAWAEISPHYGVDGNRAEEPKTIEAARLRLADAML